MYLFIYLFKAKAVHLSAMEKVGQEVGLLIILSETKCQVNASNKLQVLASTQRATWGLQSAGQTADLTLLKLLPHHNPSICCRAIMGGVMLKALRIMVHQCNAV